MRGAQWAAFPGRRDALGYFLAGETPYGTGAAGRPGAGEVRRTGYALSAVICAPSAVSRDATAAWPRSIR
jgi:hypothetical protein